MVFSTVRRFFGVAARPASKQGRRPTMRPRLESLEERWVPSTLRVGAGETYPTITAALGAANPGDTIQVDPGTYSEQVKVFQNNNGATLNNIKLLGSNGSIIQLPPTAPASQSTDVVEISVAQNVTINGFTIEGPGTGTGSIGYGIEVDGGASAVITNDHITHIRDNPLSGDQNGVGILVGRQSQNTTGSAVISHDLIDDYQKGGIVVDNTGSNAEIDHNTITGVGPTDLIAQNGIQISRGATAVVSNNTISGNVYTPQTVASTGILLFDSGVVTLDHNTLSQNDVAIYVFQPTGTVTVSQNQISGSTFDGIDLDGVSGAVVSQNQISNNGFDGIALFDDSTGNTIKQNQSKNNGDDGIFVDVGSTGNTFNQNQLQGNANLDAEDLTTGTGTDGTGNTWTKNHGKTSHPPGLVK